MKEHRITARSASVGQSWYDQKNREWREYTCGVSHNCQETIKQLTGYVLKEVK